MRGGEIVPHCEKKMLSFFLTTKCNLCCRYCYNIEERNSIVEQTIPLDVAKAAIDWYFDNNPYRHIRFYGPGEPTREFGLMKKITEYAKGKSNGGQSVSVEIQTNGVFTNQTRQWILENANIVWMSFDGMKEIQNYNRPLNPKYNYEFDGRTSADVLEDNVKWFTSNKRDNDFFIGARVTITNETIFKQREMVDYFHYLGIDYVWTNPLFYTVSKKPVCEDRQKRQSYSFNMNAYVEKYLDAYYYAKEKGVFWGSFYTINFDGESEFHCRSCHPLTAPHITPDGFVSACDMVVTGSNAYHMDAFIVGKWNQESKEFEFDYDKISVLESRKTSKLTNCKDCDIQLHCGGLCLGETMNEYGTLDARNPEKCKAVHDLFKSLGPCNRYPYLHP